MVGRGVLLMNRLFGGWGRGLLLALTASALVIASSAPVQAAGGELDRRFGGDGKVTTDVTRGFDGATDIALQPDGKLVVAGEADNKFGLARYRPDGTLDRSFGHGGTVITDVATGNDWITAVAIQANGKIVAAGDVFRHGDLTLALVRYRANGRLDPTFGRGGMVIGGTPRYDPDIVIQATGKILIAGSEGASFVLARYDPGGSLDPTFGTAGVVTTDVPDGLPYGGALALLPDGRIVLAGESSHPDYSNVVNVLRYDPDGVLDTTFGVEGLATADLTEGPDYADSVAIQPDGKIVVAGKAGFCCEYTGSFGLARFDVDGTLDSSFGTGGIVITNFTGTNGGPPDDYASEVAIQSDGKIVAAGVAGAGWGSVATFALARYDTDGTRDGTFGLNGKVTTRFRTMGPSPDVYVGAFAHAIVIQPNGKIVAVGTHDWERNGSLAGTFALVRYLPR
jgi:uncharacterized delta-60 repeat protein